VGTGHAAPVSFAPKVDYPAGGTPWSVAVADLNRDGKPDLAVTNMGSNTVSVLLGKGDGTFGAPTDFAVGDTPVHVAVADLNRDGKLDLAVANCTSACESGPGDVSVLLGNGDGTFAPKTDLATADHPDAVAVADFNRDGKPDLAVAAQSRKLSVLLGNGDGTFGTKTDLNAGPNPSFVAVGDLNRDGKPDLALADNSISELLGDGAGGFGAETGVGSASEPISVVVNDLNRDGKLDLAAPNFLDANSISVVLGNGNGTFGPTKAYSISPPGGCGGGVHGSFCNAISLAAGDLNGDAKPDLVTTLGGGSVAVVLGTGTGEFGSPAFFPSAYASVAVGDLNRDGRPDLVTGGGTVSVLVNTTPKQPATKSVLLTATRLTWTAAGVVRVPLRNPNPYSVIARVKVTTPAPVALRPDGPKRVRTFANHVFWIDARTSITLRPPLTEAGRKLLAKKANRTVRLTLTTQGPSGGPVVSSTFVPLEPATPRR
jgi:FG-GAP-like repeat